MRTSPMILITALVAASVLSPTSSRADDHAWLQRARQAFGEYDVAGTRTTDAIAELSAHLAPAAGQDVATDRDEDALAAPPTTGEREAEEARFLRAAVAADLVVIAIATYDHALLGRVARAYGVPTERVAEVVAADLDRVAAGRFAAAANDVAAGLAVVRATGSRRQQLIAALVGPRRDLAWLADARQVRESTTEPMSALAMLSADPCADPNAACAPLFAPFVESGRRAARTIVEARATFDRITTSAAAGDPFARAVAPRAAEHWQAFVGLELRPSVRVAKFMRMANGGGNALTRRSPELVVAVSAREVTWAFLPRIAVSDAGAEIFAMGAPALPGVGSIPLPSQYRSMVEPIAPLVAALSDVAGPTLTDVAVGATEDAPSHVFARVYASLVAAGWSSPMLCSLAPDGTPRMIAVRLLAADDQARGRVHIAVRPGGYWIFEPTELYIPRVRVGDEWRFDVATLSTEVSRRGRRSAVVSFQGSVTSGPVLAVLSSVRSRSPIGLRLPL